MGIKRPKGITDEQLRSILMTQLDCLKLEAGLVDEPSQPKPVKPNKPVKKT